MRIEHRSKSVVHETLCVERGRVGGAGVSPWDSLGQSSEQLGGNEAAEVEGRAQAICAGPFWKGQTRRQGDKAEVVRGRRAEGRCLYSGQGIRAIEAWMGVGVDR